MDGGVLYPVRLDEWILFVVPRMGTRAKYRGRGRRCAPQCVGETCIVV